MASKSPNKRSRREQEALQARRRKQLTFGGLGVVVLVVAAVVIFLGAQSGPKKQAGESLFGQRDTAAEFAGLEQKGELLGSPDAPYTLVEFVDLQCPACKAYSEQVIPSVIEELVRPGKVQLQMRPIAILGPDSQQAARYAYGAASQNQLFNFATLWYHNQEPENSNYVNDSFARKIAAGVKGLDANALINASKQNEQTLTTAQNVFSENGFLGTPSFLFGKRGQELKPLSLENNAEQALAQIQAEMR